MRYIFLTFSLLFFFQLYSQTGNYFLSHYSPSEDRSDNVCFDMVQDERGMVYFATRNGVLEFDGRNWNLIPVHGAVYSLQLTPKGNLYWSGANGFGKIDNKTTSDRKAETLSHVGVTDIFQSIAVNEKIFFASEQTLYIVRASEKKPIAISASKLTGSFISIFELYGSVYVNTERNGIFKIEGDKLIRSTLRLPDDEVIFCSKYNNQYLIGLANSKVLLCGEDLRPKEFKLEDQTYADASVVVSGKWVNRELFVLGTLRGGLIFVQVATGKTQEIVNYTTGLPDNEVYALMSDKNQSVWAAHEYGFTRISPYLPFRSFSHYNGLAGNLLCALSTQGKVYVGTSLGLYKLEKEEVYDEITYFIDIEIKSNDKPTVPKKQQPVSTPKPIQAEDDKPTPISTESKKKGFLRFLKRNRNKPTETVVEKTVEEKPTEPPSSVSQAPNSIQVIKPTFRSVKKIERVLRTSNYVYKKVQGINAKITQLLELDGKLVAIGLGGAFEISELLAKPILEKPVRYGYASDHHTMLLLSTYADEVHIFKPANKSWNPLPVLTDLNDRISSMVDGVGDDLWLCGLHHAFRLTVESGAIQNIQPFPIHNPTFDDQACIRWHDKIVLANSQGFLKFNRINNRFEVMDSLPKPILYFSDGENILYNDKHTWNLLGETNGQTNLQLLNLLKNLRFVTVDQDTDNFWVITGNNELYKFFGEKFTPYDAGYSPILKVVKQGEENISTSRFEVAEDKSSLTFNVVQPDYLAPQSIEYRYQLKGLEKDWSDWSIANDRIDFPYLPSGDYTLLVESRDIFGKERALSAMTFQVSPPYWQRPWFYAVEFFVFATLVLLSFRLSNRYRIISRLLSLLTIIMLIQFIQTVVSETFETRASPVTDFFLQVMVAFMILPVEGYLRTLMLRSLDTSSGLYKFLMRKAAAAASKNKLQK